MRGANITIPHKAAVLSLLDHFGHDPDVRALQAANTIVRRDDGSLLGLNTDVAGFLRALRVAGFDPRGADAVILGAGGAARAAAWGLMEAGVRSLTVVNRSAANARQLLTALPVRSSLSGPPRLAAAAPDDLRVEAIVREATLLVNATPIGADGHTSPVPASVLHTNLFVSDLIYRTTPLLRAAAERGARTQDGLEMLVQQGALAFEAWTGLPAPVNVMRAAALHVRATPRQ
jgi:shikimate dehydrogenase